MDANIIIYFLCDRANIGFTMLIIKLKKKMVEKLKRVKVVRKLKI
jgi:hypothetical protein